MAVGWVKPWVGLGWVGLGQKFLDFDGLGEKSVPVIGNEIRQK
jgi:hypothetical protein